MANEREYDEGEIREILDLAVSMEDVGRLAPTTEHGLTLSQLQEVGREAGIDPARIEEAAHAIAQRGLEAPRRTSMGMPVSVGRTIPLPRALTDREWEELVVELRETFGARGWVGSVGSIREWRNGNLHALVEPTGGGYRLRLGTRKAGAIARNRLGMVGLAVGLVALPFIAMSGGDLMELTLPAALGALALGLNLSSLPRWARQREQQMERIAGRVAAMLHRGAQPSS